MEPTCLFEQKCYITEVLKKKKKNPIAILVMKFDLKAHVLMRHVLVKKNCVKKMFINALVS
jgi:hypothetical protein